MDDFLELAKTGLALVALATAPILALAHLRQARAQERIADALLRSQPPRA